KRNGRLLKNHRREGRDSGSEGRQREQVESGRGQQQVAGLGDGGGWAGGDGVRGRGWRLHATGRSAAMATATGLAGRRSRRRRSPRRREGLGPDQQNTG